MKLRKGNKKQNEDWKSNTMGYGAQGAESSLNL